MSICIGREPEGVNAVKEEGDWEEVVMTVDSGATDTVMPPSLLPSVQLTEGAAFRRGVEYEMANGEMAPNLGEKRFKGVTEEGSEREVVAQVVEVSQSLLSVSRCVAAGNRVVFDAEGSYIENKATGEVSWMQEEGRLWTVKMWVRRQGF